LVLDILPRVNPLDILPRVNHLDILPSFNVLEIYIDIMTEHEDLIIEKSSVIAVLNENGT
jgi:hypothetical protein